MSEDDFSVNRRFYETDVVVAHYAEHLVLTEPERRVLERYADRIAAGEILDIGVGAGRTLPELTLMSRGYTAIDYAPRMIEHCRERFPTARLFCCDMQEMGIFAGGTFDVVCALLNALGDLPDEGRRRALAEIHRVLRPDGLFIFSAHNLPDAAEARIAVVVEEMYGTRLPTSYISREEQIAQLNAAGFDVVEVADWDGNVLDGGVTAHRDPCLYYVARKR
jgi:SAM-dependent methyltransferase